MKPFGQDLILHEIVGELLPDHAARGQERVDVNLVAPDKRGIVYGPFGHVDVRAE